MATGTLVDVVMPQMGVSVSEGTVTKWAKAEGDTVEADETLLEISTDKVDTEVPSPASGVVQQILVQEGETVEVGTKIAVIAPEGAAAPTPAAPAEEAPAEEAPAEQQAPEPLPAAVAEQPPSAVADETPSTVADQPPTPAADQPPTAVADETPSTVADQPPTAVADEPPAAADEPPTAVAEPAAAPAEPTPPPTAEPQLTTDSENGARFVSPVVARIAAEHGVDVARIEGTGRGGRVTKKDILAFIESGAAAPAVAPEAPAEAPEAPPEVPPPAPAEAPAPPAAAPPAAAAPSPPQPAPAAAQQGETVEPMSAMRRGIAEHMRRSLDTSAHVTSAIEVDMTRVVALRQTLKRAYQDAYGVNPTFLAFVARAAVETLKDYPWLNGELRDEGIVTRSYVNLGFAVELADGKGLIVPVVKNAETLNLLGMAKAIADIAARARDKKLLPEDVQGGTFTITNPGGYGTFHGTPVISQPQAGILGTYAVVKRPWVVQDEMGDDVIAIRSIMNLTLTYDHRLVDGALAGRFLRDLRHRLETWGESDY